MALPAVPRWLRRAVAVFAVTVAAIQLVPFGWQRTNPPVRAEPSWPSASAESLARTACYDCHSNETRWPPHAYVAPFSWLVIDDVQQGRDELNFSEWDGHDGEADDAAEEILDGSMPPARYTLLHRDARLSDAERRELVDALREIQAAR